MSKNRDKKHAAHKAGAAAHTQEVIESTAGLHEQHLVEAPKGTSKARFLFNFILVVFLLLIFSITGPMMSSLGGNPNPNADKAYMTWNTPDGKRRSYTYEQFRDQKRAISYLEIVRQSLFLGEGDSKEDIFAARFLILEQLAERSGIHVSDEELSESITNFFGTRDNYLGWVGNMRGLTTKAFEKVYRRWLAVRRYAVTDFVISTEVLSEDVVSLWLEDAKEFNFEFAVANAADFEEAARAELIDDEALEDYFTALPPFEKTAFNTERSVAANLAWYDPTAEQEYASLLERFPAQGVETPEAIAERYYTTFSHIRFLRDVPETDEERKAAEAAGGEDRFLSFEESKEQAMREAPVYYAMIEWLKELELREASGEEFSFEVEAAAMNLSYASVDPRTRVNWTDGEESWAGRYLWSALGSGKDGGFATRVAVEEKALVIANVVQVLPPELPPFAEIRDKVADKWVKGKAPELAVAKLETVRDAFGTRPEGDALFETTATSEEFRAAVEAAGLTVEERGWGRQNPLPSSDLKGDAEFYIRSKGMLFAQAADTVVAASTSNDKKKAYLMRCMGERAGDPSTMTPAEASNYKNRATQTRANEVYTSTFGNDDWFRTKFKIILESDKEEEIEG